MFCTLAWVSSPEKFGSGTHKTSPAGMAGSYAWPQARSAEALCRLSCGEGTGEPSRTLSGSQLPQGSVSPVKASSHGACSCSSCISFALTHREERNGHFVLWVKVLLMWLASLRKNPCPSILRAVCPHAAVCWGRWGKSGLGCAGSEHPRAAKGRL